MVSAAGIARCVARVEAARLRPYQKTLARWALQHPNRTDRAGRCAHLLGRAGNSQLWSATSLSIQAQWHKHKGPGLKSMCLKALVAAAACGAMVRWEASGPGVLFMPVRLHRSVASEHLAHCR